MDWRQDIDVGIDRSKEDLSDWKRRDPIKKLTKALQTQTYFSTEDYQNLEKTIKFKVNEAWEGAIKEPSPNWVDSFKYVFKI